MDEEAREPSSLRRYSWRDPRHASFHSAVIACATGRYGAPKQGEMEGRSTYAPDQWPSSTVGPDLSRLRHQRGSPPDDRRSAYRPRPPESPPPHAEMPARAARPSTRRTSRPPEAEDSS